MRKVDGKMSEGERRKKERCWDHLKKDSIPSTAKLILMSWYSCWRSSTNCCNVRAPSCRGIPLSTCTTGTQIILHFVIEIVSFLSKPVLYSAPVQPIPEPRV